MNAREKTIILTIFFVLGSSSIIAQSMVFREFLVVFYGNELCTGAILGIWLFSIAFGAWIYAAALSRMRAVNLLFSLNLLVFSFLPSLQVLFVRSVREILKIQVGLCIPFPLMLLFTTVVILPYGTVLGLLFPLGCRLLSREEEPRAIAWVYILESFGSLLGGILFSFFLINRWSAVEIASGIFIAILLLLLVFLGEKSPGSIRLSLFCLIPVLLGIFISLLPHVRALQERSVEKRWNSLVPGLPLLISLDSKYQNLALTRQSEQFSVFGNGQYDFSFPDPYQEAITANLVLTQHPNPQKVLLLGESSGGLLSEMLRYGVKELHYVLLDERLLELIRPHLEEKGMIAFKDSRVKIFFRDGRSYVSSSRDHYDVIFVNLPDPSTAMLNRFYTQEFLVSLRRLMDPGSVLALHLTSAENYLGREVGDYNISIFNTLKVVFPCVVISPGDINYYFASPSPVVTSNPQALATRFNARGITGSSFAPEMLEMFYQPERVEFMEKTLKGRRGKINTDLRPITYFYNLLLWDKFSGSHLGRIIRPLESLSIALMIAAALLLLLARGIHVLVRRPPQGLQRKFNLIFAVAACGFSAMGFEIVLIFVYQNIFGYLYQMIGLLVACFMFGLAVGGMVADHLWKKGAISLKGLIGVQVGLTLLCFSSPTMLSLLSSPSFLRMPAAISHALFLSLLWGIGLITGLVLPMASSLYLEEEKGIGRVAGVIDGADHLGAGFGGLFFGTLLVPVVGTGDSCLCLGILNITGILLWVMAWISGARHRGP